MPPFDAPARMRYNGRAARLPPRRERGKTMEIVVEKAVLHLLDPQAAAPVLSDEWIDDEASLGYLGALAAKAYKSEEAKACTLEPDGPGAQAAAMASGISAPFSFCPENRCRSTPA